MQLSEQSISIHIQSILDAFTLGFFFISERYPLSKMHKVKIQMGYLCLWRISVVFKAMDYANITTTIITVHTFSLSFKVLVVFQSVVHCTKVNEAVV